MAKIQFGLGDQRLAIVAVCFYLGIVPIPCRRLGVFSIARSTFACRCDRKPNRSMDKLVFVATDSWIYWLVPALAFYPCNLKLR